MAQLKKYWFPHELEDPTSPNLKMCISCTSTFESQSPFALGGTNGTSNWWRRWWRWTRSRVRKSWWSGVTLVVYIKYLGTSDPNMPGRKLSWWSWWWTSYRLSLEFETVNDPAIGTVVQGPNPPAGPQAEPPKEDLVQPLDPAEEHAKREVRIAEIRSLGGSDLFIWFGTTYITCWSYCSLAGYVNYIN